MNDDLKHPVLAEGLRLGALNRFEEGLDELKTANRKAAVLGIVGLVSGAFDLEPRHLLGRCRQGQIATARMVSMWLCRQVLGIDFGTIGRHHGGRDHSTASYADQAIRERREVYPKFKTTTDQLLEMARKFTHEAVDLSS